MSNSDRAPSRIFLFAPFVALIVVLVLHAAYWTYAASQIEQRALTWIEQQQAAGYQVNYNSLRVCGYPFRFSLRADAASLTAPRSEGGWTTQVERLSASAQFYDLNHWIVTPDGEGQITAGSARYQLVAESARLSLRASDGATSRLGANIDGLVVTTLSGPQAAITALGSLAISGFLDEDDQLALRVQGEGVRFGDGVLEPDLVNAFGPQLDLVRADMVVTQWTALARVADPLEWRMANGALVINQSQLVWGPADLSGEGQIGLDADLLPEGRLSVVVTDPETLIGGLEAAGLVVDEQGEALRLAALMAPRREGGIALPFRLREGGVFLGPARIDTFAERDS
ncbi:DUF2125 domain-containing protein [Maricaulaceae bacterium NA33B04]|nr:DUF2125 domain-containing protein [Maricaulaceae bacterium NA33B04]